MRWKNIGPIRSLAGFGALAIPLLFGVEAANAQVASPIQGGHYLPGMMGIRDFATPPPGVFGNWYNWWSWSDTYVDRNGNELGAINLSSLDPSLPDANVDVDIRGFATVPYFIWASDATPLGGARFMAQLALTYMDARYSTVTEIGGPGLQPGEFRHEEGDVSGWSDLVVAPLGLSWAFGEFSDGSVSDEEMAEAGLPPLRRFNLTLIYSFAAPTGRFELGEDDNVGLGFWTHMFQGFGYFYPFVDQSTAILAGLTYEVNGEIDGAEVKPGSRLSLEWGVSQYLTEYLEVGVLSAHNWQVGDDSGTDVYWDTSVHDKKNSLLFQLGVWPKPGRLYLSGKYGFDYGVRQQFKAGQLVLSASLVTGFLDGRD